MPVIEVKGLSKFYGGFAAIEDVSFSIREGEIVGLLGLNGAGKSTILKILGTFLIPSRGDAYICGHHIEERADQVRSLIGYLPDTPPVYDEMNVTAYLRYVASLKDVPKERINVCVEDAIQKTNLAEVRWVTLGELSHGFRQRVGIAQALVHDPKILILDEPINGLDPVQIVEMRDLILSLRGKHTVILSSHILSEITKTCDRILIIDEGRLVAEGRESELTAGVSISMRVIVEVAPMQGMRELLAKVSGVVSVTPQSGLSGGEKYLVQSSSDVRAELARTVIAQGGQLLGLHRDGDGLEGVFMRMVKDTHGHRQRGDA